MRRLELFGDDASPDLEIAIRIAQDRAGNCPPFAGLSAHRLEDVANDIVAASGSINIQRSPAERRAVAELLVVVLSEALLHGYDIDDAGVRRSLLNVAALAHTNHNEPMRVLGATAEAFRGYAR